MYVAMVDNFILYDCFIFCRGGSRGNKCTPPLANPTIHIVNTYTEILAIQGAYAFSSASIISHKRLKYSNRAVTFPYRIHNYVYAKLQVAA